MTPTIAVFLKAPRRGQVKLPAGRHIGARQALRLYRYGRADSGGVVRAVWRPTVRSRGGCYGRAPRLAGR